MASLTFKQVAARMWDLRPDGGSLAFMAAAVAGAWWLFGWSPIPLALTLAVVVAALVAVTAVLELRADVGGGPVEADGDADGRP